MIAKDIATVGIALAADRGSVGAGAGGRHGRDAPGGSSPDHSCLGGGQMEKSGEGGARGPHGSESSERLDCL